MSIHSQVSQPSFRLVGAEAEDGKLRYALQSSSPARAIKYEMTQFLYDFGFGREDRAISVRLYDRYGRFAWEAAYEGTGEARVRMRPDLSGCRPALDGRWLPRVPPVVNAPRCPVEPLRISPEPTKVLG